MGRKKIAPQRELLPDPKYGSLVLSKFISRMMLQGKRSVGTGIAYDALERIKERGNEKPLDVFLKALENVKPTVEVKSRRVGGSTYQVPVEVNERRREALAMRWIIYAARARSGRSMSEKLANELLDASNSSGVAFKKKED